MTPGNPVDHSECRALGDVLARVGDKWTIFVVALLSERSMRFNELRRAVGAISQRMLTLTLKGLERDGLVTRTVHPTIPPRVDYELTPIGRTLIDPLKALHAWSTGNRATIETARARYETPGRSKSPPTPRRQDLPPPRPARPSSRRPGDAADALERCGYIWCALRESNPSLQRERLPS